MPVKFNKNMSIKYMFHDTNHMIDLAKEIQSKVYWGGFFYLTDENNCEYQYNWRDLWSCIENARNTKNAVGIMIDENYVRFIY